MQILKEKITGIIACLAEALIGILLLINPFGFTSTIIIAIGILLLLGGIAMIIRYFRTPIGRTVIEHSLAVGLICVIAGLFCVFNYKWFIVIFPVLTVLYGIVNLIIGLFKIQFTVDAIRLNARWGWAALSAFVTLAFAVIIILNPFSSTVALWMFVGITLIVEAVIDMVSIIISGRKTVHTN